MNLLPPLSALLVHPWAENPTSHCLPETTPSSPALIQCALVFFQIYEARSSLQHRNSVIVSVVFTSLLQNQLKELEFNVLDSLNTKLVRTVSANNYRCVHSLCSCAVTRHFVSCNHLTYLFSQNGTSLHDPVKVPFILLPESQNEGQFAFTVESISMPQKLKGTLTYMIKVVSKNNFDFRLDSQMLFALKFALVVLCGHWQMWWLLFPDWRRFNAGQNWLQTQFVVFIISCRYSLQWVSRACCCSQTFCGSRVFCAVKQKLSPHNFRGASASVAWSNCCRTWLCHYLPKPYG